MALASPVTVPETVDVELVPSDTSAGPVLWVLTGRDLQMLGAGSGLTAVVLGVGYALFRLLF